jgi:hypothetical protein
MAIGTSTRIVSTICHTSSFVTEEQIAAGLMAYLIVTACLASYVAGAVTMWLVWVSFGRYELPPGWWR